MVGKITKLRGQRERVIDALQACVDAANSLVSLADGLTKNGDGLNEDGFSQLCRLKDVITWCSKELDVSETGHRYYAKRLPANGPWCVFDVRKGDQIHQTYCDCFDDEDGERAKRIAALLNFDEE